jgi:hypothetical protein
MNDHKLAHTCQERMRSIVASLTRKESISWARLIAARAFETCRAAAGEHVRRVEGPASSCCTAGACRTEAR